MKTYKVKLSAKARKVFKKRDRSQISRLRAAIEQIALNPHSGKPLTGPLKRSFAWRVGNWRIIYAIYDDIIEIERIEWRDKAYR